MRLVTNTKSDNVNVIGFTITGTENRIILDNAKSPVDGIIIFFVSAKGITGNVEIPMKQYNKELALKLVSEKVIKLEELLP